MSFLNEEDLENISIEWFKDIGYSSVHGPNLAPDGQSSEREDFRQLTLTDRLRSALKKLNPEVPPATIESAVLQLTNPNIPGLLSSNRKFYQLIKTGLPITYIDGDELKIKTLLKRYKYPPNQQAIAVHLVLQQAETLGEELTIGYE